MEANHLPHMGTPDGRALFERYFASRGEERRRLLGQLVVANTPLVKVLLGQMLGISQGPRAKGYRSMSGQAAFREIPWDEGMQVGMIALLKGFQQFRPDKGKFSPFLKWKLFYELQEYVGKEQGLIRVKRGDTAPGVALTDDESFLDDMAGGVEDPALMALHQDPESVGGALVIEDADMGAMRAANDVRSLGYPWSVPGAAISGLEAFLTNRVALHRAGRVETFRAHNAYRIECRRVGRGELARPAFVAELGRLAGISEVWVRTTARSSERALAGMRLCG